MTTTTTTTSTTVTTMVTSTSTTSLLPTTTLPTTTTTTTTLPPLSPGDPCPRVGDVVLPVCPSCSPRESSPVADRLGLRGEVVVLIEIDENGRVAAAEVTAVRAARNESQLRELALKSARRRQYRPATWHGGPCRAHVEVTLKYEQERSAELPFRIPSSSMAAKKPPFGGETSAAETPASVPGEAAEARSELERLGAPRTPVAARAVKLMLAETRDEPFSDPGWIFELKHDGFRVLAVKEGEEARLLYRKGSDATAIFPEVARAVSSLPFASLIMDGEVVCLDDQSRSSFQRLQRRALLQRRTDIQRAAAELPATLYLFDLMAFEDFDLRPLPLLERKRMLRMLLPRAGPLRYVDHIPEQGEAFYTEVSRLRLEGIMAKRTDATYRGGRSADWLKIKAERTDDFVVVGYTLPQGSRAGLGALHLAGYDGERLVYAGRVGTGFSDRQLVETRARLDADRRPRPAWAGPGPEGPEHVWVEPRFVAEVRYKEWTRDHLLRQPVFVRFRDDKPLGECLLPSTEKPELPRVG